MVPTLCAFVRLDGWFFVSCSDTKDGSRAGCCMVGVKHYKRGLARIRNPVGRGRGLARIRNPVGHHPMLQRSDFPEFHY